MNKIKFPMIKNKLTISDTERYHRKLGKKFEKKALRPPKPPPHPCLIETMTMTGHVLKDIRESIGKRPAESGGILLSNTHDYSISCFVFDNAAAMHPTIYQPNTEFLNSVLKGRNEDFVGIAHSHRGFWSLSGQDKRAAWSNMTSPENRHLNAYLMPLIKTIPDTGRFEIIPYIVTCHPKGMGRVIVRKVELEIIG
jgi:hypothetical protein